jgi:hypothetical protein
MRGERQTEGEEQGGGDGKGLEHGPVYSFVVRGHCRIDAAVNAPRRLNRT